MVQRQKITLKEMARRLGVAESSVSRAINGKPGVSLELRHKILSLAEKMHYHPNALAQGLALEKSKNIGVIIPDLEATFFRRVYQGIDGVANQEGYRLILGNTQGDEQQEHYYMNLFHSMQADGVIVLGEGLVGLDVMRLALGSSPLVLINCYLEEIPVPSLLLDHQGGVYQAVNALLSQGYERLLLLNGPEEDFFSQELDSGCRQAFLDWGLEGPWQVVHAPLQRETGYHTICSLLEAGEVPEALMGANELVTIGAIDALQRGGFFVPEDVAVVAYGDSIIAQVSSPTITTIREPALQMGRQAMEMILQLVGGEEDLPLVEIMEGELVFRGSFLPNIKKQEV